MKIKHGEPYSLVHVRRGAVHFLTGKALSAALSFTAFLLVARLLASTQYGYYVAALAVVEIAFGFSSLGLDWVALRYVPEYRVHGTGAQLTRFILWLSAAQATVFVVFAVGLALGAELIAGWVAVPAAEKALQVYAAYFFVEALSRVLRDHVLAYLLLQGRAQIALVARNAMWVAGLAWFYFHGFEITVVNVALIELGAAAVGLAGAMLGLAAALRHVNRRRPVHTTIWTPPKLSEAWLLARASYVSYLLSLCYGPQTVTLILSRFAGIEAAAAFGFARNLADQIKRFLPVELLLGLIRPTLIARYSVSRDFIDFNRNAAVLLVISSIALAPVIVLGVAYGDLIIGVLAARKFQQGPAFLAFLLLALPAFSHRRIIETVANTIGQPGACVRANLLLVGAPACMVLLLKAGEPAWSVGVVSFIAEWIFSLAVILDLRKGGVLYRLPLQPMLRIALAGGLALGTLWALPISLSGFSGLLVAGAATLGLTSLWLWICNAVDDQTQASFARVWSRGKHA